MKMRYTGFTLAEVLITLGIIGVVASMTIPTLMNQTSKEQYKTALKANFSILNQAQGQLRAEGSLPAKDSSTYVDLLIGKLKVANSCIVNDAGCWFAANVVKNYSDVEVSITTNWYQKVITLMNGAMLLMPAGGWPANAPHSPIYGTEASSIVIDINGFKPPNKIGDDIFFLESYGEGFVPYGATNAHYKGSYNDSCIKNASTSNLNGADCTAKALLNQDY